MGDSAGSGSTDGAGTPAAPAAVLRCIVPKLTGKTLKAARAALTKAGCKLGKVQRKRSARKAGRVLEQRTRAGRRVARGTKVALVIGKR